MDVFILFTFFYSFIYLYIYDLFIIFGIKRAWVKTIRSENPYQHSALKTGRNFADLTPPPANLSRRFWTSAICFSSPCLVVCVLLKWLPLHWNLFYQMSKVRSFHWTRNLASFFQPVRISSNDLSIIVACSKVHSGQTLEAYRADKSAL